MQARNTDAKAARLRADLDQLLYAAGHDLAEPARTVRGFLDLLERRHGSALAPDAKEFVAFARDAAERLEAMLAALLELGRIGRCEHQVDPIDLGAIVREAVAGLKPQIERLEAVVTIGEMPETTGDPRLWRRLFTILLMNSLTYRGQARPLVQITADAAMIRVADNGIGIDPAFRERVFEPFQRLHTRDAIPGIGMGLTIARRIAEHHGGCLRLEPSTPAGTTMLIELAEHPVQLAPVSQPARAASARCR